MSLGQYAPVSGCGPGCLPAASSTPPASRRRQALRLAALIVLLVAGIGVALALAGLTPAGRDRLLRYWFRGILRASGVRLRVHSHDPGPADDPGLADGRNGLGGLRLSAPGPSGTLVAANHVSWLDIPAVLAVEPMPVVAKSDVRRWPVVGAMAARGGTLFIDRRRLRRLPVTVADMAGTLRSGRSVLVFPEGTTWCGRTLGRFFPAAFQSAIDAGAPVRAITLRYVLADGTPTTTAAFLGDETLVDSVRRVVACRGLVVELSIGPVTDSIGAGRRALAGQTAALIRNSAFPVTRWPHRCGDPVRTGGATYRR